MKKYLASFGSDNFSGVCPEVMDSLMQANKGHVPAYGLDPYTEEAIKAIQQEFGKTTQVFFVFNGTGANISALKSVLSSHESVVCAETAHIYTQETGAIFDQIGCKVLPIPSENGKIRPDQIETAVQKERFWGRHATSPKLVSISQSTEYGTLYTLEEIRQISKKCRQLNLLLHVDGCRLPNAAVALKAKLGQFNGTLGIDILCFGGTKNGLLGAEAVLFFDPSLAKNYELVQKQLLQLASKMRFLSAQFLPYLKDEVWKKNASHANKMAQKLAAGLKQHPEIDFAQKVESNQLFLRLPKALLKALEKDFFFYVWDEKMNEIRMITSFDTKEKEVDLFLKHVEKFYKK
jgi:threonine aldolase